MQKTPFTGFFINLGEQLDEKQSSIIERLRAFIDGDEIFLDIDYSKFC